MENKGLKEKIKLNEKFTTSQEKGGTSLNETNFNQSLTNEQKLEYLSKLIQDAEQNLDANGISKSLVRQNKNII